MGITDMNSIHGPATRRVLYARIATRASDADVRRAERVLLRGIERRWPDARIERLLQGLWLRTALQASAGEPR